MRRLRNWSYRDVTDFLIEHGFSFSKELGGSHQAWSRGNRTVIVNFSHSSYPIKTIRRMVSQSEIDEDEWIKWAAL